MIEMTYDEAYSKLLNTYPDVMNTEQMCEVLSVSVKTCYKILRSGDIQSIKVGREYRIPKVFLLSYLKIWYYKHGPIE